MRRVAAIELRRPALLLGWGLLVAGQLWLMLTDIAEWRGIWPMASAAVGAPWAFLGPAAAGLSAYDAVRRPRPAVETLGWRTVSSAMLVARMILVAGVVAVGAAFAGLVTLASDAPDGGLWGSYLTVTLAFAVWSVALGMLVGSFGGPSWFPPVVALLVAFLRGVWFQGAGPESPGAAFTRVFLAGRPWHELDPVAVIAAVAEAALLLIVALGAPVLAARIRGRFAGATFAPHRAGVVLGVSVASMVVLCIGVVLTSPPIVRDRTAPPVIPCTDTLPQVCVWPEHASLLPALAETTSRAQRVSQAVEGSLMSRIDEFGLGDEDTFVAVGQGTWFLSDTLAGTIAGSLAPVRCDSPESDPQVAVYFAARSEVSALLQLEIEDEVWPAGYGNSLGVDRTEVARVWRAPAAERDAWVDDRVALMRESVEMWCG